MRCKAGFDFASMRYSLGVFRRGRATSRCSPRHCVPHWTYTRIKPAHPVVRQWKFHLSEADAWVKSGDADVSKGSASAERFGDSTMVGRKHMLGEDVLKQLVRVCGDSDQGSLKVMARVKFPRCLNRISE